MPLTSLPRSSRSATAERLDQLRARAVARLEEEERAAGISWSGAADSRRGVLRRFGILLAGAVPGVAALAQAAYAAAPGGSVRSCAPQYGAPSWPAPAPPPYSPRPTAPVTNSRTELGDAKIWRNAAASVIPRNGEGDWRGLNSVTVKEGYYNDAWGGGTHALIALADPDTKTGYILRGDQSFYTATDSDMIAGLLQPGVLLLHGSLYRRKMDDDGVAGVIAGFTSVSDTEAYRRDREATNINLEKGLPQEFWIRNAESGWQPNYIGIANAQRKGNILQIEAQSNGLQSKATFVIDLKAQKLVTTKFEGKEWAS